MTNNMNTRMLAVALAAILATPAVAQTAGSTTPQPTTPMLTAPSAANDGMYQSQRGDWRASRLMGAKVTNTAGESIGDINDLLIDQDQTLASAIIGIGGFLGMGERHAAFKFSSLQLTRDTSNNPVLSVNATKEQLKAMPEWQWNAATGEWRANKLVGAKVTANNGDTIGDINELVVNQDGKVAAAVIGVGGYLGMGERYAAVPFGSLSLTRDADNNPLVALNLSKEQLKTMPEWKWQPVATN